MTRQGVVHLLDGRAFEGDVSISDGFVHFEGRRRVRHGDDVLYRVAGGRTWPRRQIREIRWLDDDDGAQ